MNQVYGLISAYRYLNIGIQWKMADKGVDTKFSRHEKSKEKHRSFQRTLSSKQMHQTETIPCIGQYIVHTKNQRSGSVLPNINKDKTSKAQEIKFTKNIKLILKEKRPYAVTEVINDVVNQKITNSSMKNIATRNMENTQNLSVRPISAQIYEEVANYKSLDESHVIKEAYQFDKKYLQRQLEQKSNTFQVKSRLLYPRHIQGHQLIKLEGRKLTKDIQPNNMANSVTQTTIGEKDDDYNVKFLPLEYYIVDDEDPQFMMGKYKDSSSAYVYGESKWFDQNGTFVWKKCRISGFDRKRQRWAIEWLHNGNSKKVSRNNLRFDNQDKAAFEGKIKRAEMCREKSQIFMKYNWMIDLMQNPTHQLTKEKETHIVELAISGKLTGLLKTKPTLSREGSALKKQRRVLCTQSTELKPYLQKLISQIKALYVRANHQAQFNFTLPFNAQRKITFINFLPKCLFSPNRQTELMVHSKLEIQKDNKAVLKKQFQTNLQKIKDKSSLSNPFRLKILDNLSKIEEQLQKHRLFKLDAKKKLLPYTVSNIISAITLQEFMETIDNSIRQAFYLINCRICDLEHLVGIQLDPLYLDKKKIGQENFTKIMSNYRKFLYVVNFRLESLIEEMFIETLNKIIQPFAEWNRFMKNQESQLNEQSFRKKLTNYNVHSDYKGIRISLKMQAKDGKLEIQPQVGKVKQFFLGLVDKIMDKIADLQCVNKSYIEFVRPNNKLRVLMSSRQDQNQLKQSVLEVQKRYKQEIGLAFSTLEDYVKQIENVVTQIGNISNDSKKRAQKKNNYADFEETIEIAQNMNRNIDNLVSKETVNFIVFNLSCQDILKEKSKIAEAMKDLYKLLHERIIRQNQKLEKHIDSIIKELEKDPKNIEEMVELEEYSNGFVTDEMQKINSKVNSLTGRVSLLQSTGCKVEYKDFQACFKVLTKPLHVMRKRTDCLRDIQYVHKKNFGEELTRETLAMLEEIKECEDKASQYVQIKDLESMKSSFLAYSKFHERLQTGISKMNLINDRQQKLKWKITNFSRLTEINEEFEPYFKLISLAKNFSYHIEPQMGEPFFGIDAIYLKSEIQTACKTLQALQSDIFVSNTHILEVVTQIQGQYLSFKKHLPMITALRNHDLKERHWVRIKKITNFPDIQSEYTTINILLQKNIEGYSKQIQEISAIASRQLAYEKQLNRLKKEWKQVRLLIENYGSSETEAVESKGEQSKGSEKLKIMTNLDKIHKKAESDIYNLQVILSCSFIKFLETDIVSWRNSVLYVTYEVVQAWTRVQNRLITLNRVFSNGKIEQELNQEFKKFKSVEKRWRNNILQIESQPSIIELLQSKIVKNMKFIEELMEGIEVQLDKYFELKKQNSARINVLSNEQMMRAYSITSQYGNNSSLDEFLLKCFAGIATIERTTLTQEKDPRRQRVSGIVSIRTHLNEKMSIGNMVSEIVGRQQGVQYLQLQIIMQTLEKQISNKLADYLNEEWYKSETKCVKKQIRNHLGDTLQQSIQNQLISDNQKQHPIAQIRLLKKRIQFTFQVEDAFMSKTRETALSNLFISLTQQKDNQISQLLNSNTGNIALGSQLIQLSNQIQVLEQIMKKRVSRKDDFLWQSQVRTYMNPTNTKSPQVFVSIGPYKSKYKFSLVKNQNYVASFNSHRVFLAMATALKDRMLVNVQGPKSSGKTFTINYLCQLLGRQINTIYCHSIMTPKLIVNYLRMSSAGLWVNLKNIDLMSNQMISAFSSALEIVWTNIQKCKKQYTANLDGRIINCQADEFGIFATLRNTLPTNQSRLPDQLKNYFRSITFLEPDLSYILSIWMSSQQFFIENLDLKLAAIANDIEALLSQTSKQQQKSDCDEKCSDKQLLSEQFEKIISQQEPKQLQPKKQQKQANNDQHQKNLAFGGFFHKFKFLKLLLVAIEDLQLSQQGQKLMQEQIIEKALQSTVEKFLLEGKLKNNLFTMLKQKYEFRFEQELKNEHFKATMDCLRKKNSIIQNTVIQNEGSIIIKIHAQTNKRQGQQDVQLGPNSSEEQVLTFALRQRKLYYNTQILSAFKTLMNAVRENRGVVLISDQIAGKSALINALQNIKLETFSIKIDHINPMAMRLPDLHGDEATYNQITRTPSPPKQGVFNLLLQEIAQSLKGESQVQFRGLHLDSDFSSKWYQPLMSLLSDQVTLYNYPKGGSLDIGQLQKLRLIFEATSLAHASPNILSSVIILPIQTNLKWQNIFSSYIRTSFNPNYSKTPFINFVELMVPFILDPILEFYQASFSKINSKRHIPASYSKNCVTKKIKSIQIVGMCLRMFQSLLDQTIPAQTQIQKVILTQKSDLFNIFLFSIIWTIGVLMPEQAKNTFSRHFKYLIKRAIQINIRGIDKATLPTDQQSIYDIYYSEGRWKSWQEFSIAREESSTHWPIISPDCTRIFYIMEKYIKHSKSTFLIGKPSSGKNFIFSQYLQSLNTQKFSSTSLCFSPISTVDKFKQTMAKYLIKDKYGESVNGLLNVKTTVIYICDINLPSIKSQTDSQAALNYTTIVEFLRQFFTTGSLYLQDSARPRKFRNLVFCGSMNSELDIPERILGDMNPLMVFWGEGKLKSILQSIVKSELGKCGSHQLPETCRQKLVQWVSNFHEVMKREYESLSEINLTSRDLIRICKVVVRMVSILGKQQETEQQLKETEIRHHLMRRWIYQSESVYSQKLTNYKQQKLFYYINNVIMEQERDRYKRIMPQPNLQITNLSTSSHFQQITLPNLKAQILQTLSQQTDLIQTFNQSVQTEIPLQFILTDELVLSLVKLSNGLTVESPIAICIDQRASSIKALVDILAFYKKRDVLTFQVTKSGSQGLKQWIQFVKQTLLQKLEDYEDVIILIEIEKSQSEEDPINPQYILDDLLNLRKLGCLTSLTLAKQQKMLEEQQHSPFGYSALCRKNSFKKYEKAKQQLGKMEIGNQEIDQFKQNEDAQQSDTYASDKDLVSSKIWTILHYKEKNPYLLKHYQTLLNESTVIWMTPQPTESFHFTRVITENNLKPQIQSKSELNRQVKQTEQGQKSELNQDEQQMIDE